MRILGHLLMWIGFLTAATATVCQIEFDLLPEKERQLLATLPDSVSLTQGEFGSVDVSSRQ